MDKRFSTAWDGSRPSMTERRGDMEAEQMADDAERTPGRGGDGPEPPPPRPLDAIDRDILRILQTDGRASIRSVAERVHVSRANAYARINRLLDDGVIRGFSARVNHERAGQGASAYITLKIVQNSWRTVREQLQELPGATHIALVSGDFDVLLLVHTPGQPDAARTGPDQTSGHSRGAVDAHAAGVRGDGPGPGRGHRAASLGSGSLRRFTRAPYAARRRPAVRPRPPPGHGRSRRPRAAGTTPPGS